MQRFVNSDAWRSFRYRLTLLTARREYYDYTTFFRLPRQFDALGGPVLDFLDARERPLEIVVLGCSAGAEPYSIASYLTLRHPELAFHIQAIDLNPELITAARRGEYPAEQVLESPMDAEFRAHAFDRRGDRFVVRPEIARHVTFAVGNMLDPDLARRTRPADLVVVQNVLYHLKPRVAQRAFRNACGVLKDRGAIFCDGMDLPLRTDLTRQLHLEPLDFQVPEIHDDARVLRGGMWPWTYWGLEPFDARARDATRRYATIFLKSAA